MSPSSLLLLTLLLLPLTLTAHSQPSSPCGPLVALLSSPTASPAHVEQTLRDDETGCEHTTALLGIFLARTPSRLDDGVALLERVARAHPHDWVSASYLGAAYELLARRLAAHVPKGGPSTSSTDGRYTGPGTAGSKASGSGEPYRQALERAAHHLGTAAGVRSDGLRTDKDAPAPPPALPHASLAQPPSYLYRSLGNVLLWLGREYEARLAFEAGVRDPQTKWVSPWARPADAYALPGLPRGLPVPFFGRGDGLDALLDSFEAALDGVREEFWALLRSQGEAAVDAATGGIGSMSGSTTSPSSSTPRGPALSSAGFVPESAGLSSDERWRVLTLALNGRPVNSTRCALMTPRTCALIASTPLAASVRDGQAKFSVLERGAWVRPHAGPTNARLRVHCTLTLFDSGGEREEEGIGGKGGGGEAASTFRVGEVKRHWRDRECFAFDESFEHEVTTSGELEKESRSAAVVAARGGAGDKEEEEGGSPSSSPLRAPFRAVLLVDIANPFLSLDDFKRAAVRDGAWDAHGKELEAAWAAVRDAWRGR
jgi:hypothetical protein